MRSESEKQPLFFLVLSKSIRYVLESSSDFYTRTSKIFMDACVRDQATTDERDCAESTTQFLLGAFLFALCLTFWGLSVGFVTILQEANGAGEAKSLIANLKGVIAILYAPIEVSNWIFSNSPAIVLARLLFLTLIYGFLGVLICRVTWNRISKQSQKIGFFLQLCGTWWLLQTAGVICSAIVIWIIPFDYYPPFIARVTPRPESLIFAFGLVMPVILQLIFRLRQSGWKICGKGTIKRFLTAYFCPFVLTILPTFAFYTAFAFEPDSPKFQFSVANNCGKISGSHCHLIVRSPFHSPLQLENLSLGIKRSGKAGAEFNVFVTQVDTFNPVVTSRDNLSIVQLTTPDMTDRSFKKSCATLGLATNNIDFATIQPGDFYLDTKASGTHSIFLGATFRRQFVRFDIENPNLLADWVLQQCQAVHGSSTNPDPLAIRK